MLGRHLGDDVLYDEVTISFVLLLVWKVIYDRGVNSLWPGSQMDWSSGSRSAERCALYLHEVTTISTVSGPQSYCMIRAPPRVLSYDDPVKIRQAYFGNIHNIERWWHCKSLGTCSLRLVSGAGKFPLLPDSLDEIQSASTPRLLSPGAAY